MCYMPPHLILFDLFTRKIFGEEYRSLSSSLCSFLHSPITSSFLGPNILLSTLFSNTLSLRFSFNASDQVSHPYKKTIVGCTNTKILKWIRYLANMYQEKGPLFSLLSGTEFVYNNRVCVKTLISYILVSSSCEYFYISAPDGGIRPKHVVYLIRQWMKCIKFM